MDVINAYIRSFLNNTLNAEGNIALQQWMRQSEKNKKYFKDCIIIWKATAITTNEEDLNIETAYRKFQLKDKKVKQISFYKNAVNILSAVILLLLIGIGSVLFFIKSKKPQNATQQFIVEVPTGAKSKITFPDGSVVWLNSESKIEYDSDFAKVSRNVSLEGEGYFEVNKNKHLPFVVKTANLAVEVLGTKFNIKSYDEDMDVKVTLKEGAVKIEQHGNKFDPIILTPNQQLTYLKSNEAMLLNSLDANHIESWRDGSMAFDKVSLNEIVKQLERQYKIPIEIENEELKKIIYYSDFKENTAVEKILNTLSSGNKFKYDIKPDYIRIYN